MFSEDSSAESFEKLDLSGSLVSRKWLGEEVGSALPYMASEKLGATSVGREITRSLCGPEASFETDCTAILHWPANKSAAA